MLPAIIGGIALALGVAAYHESKSVTPDGEGKKPAVKPKKLSEAEAYAKGVSEGTAKAKADSDAETKRKTEFDAAVEHRANDKLKAAKKLIAEAGD